MDIQANLSKTIDTYSVKPIIKWAGGKRRIVAELLSQFPADWNEGTYFEPFFGGGAVFLHVKPTAAVVADVNSRLYWFYSHIKLNPILLHSRIIEVTERFNSINEIRKKEFYLDLRATYNSSNIDSYESATLLYVINKLCFNGLYRENSKGGFNVPFGQKKYLPPMDLVELCAVSKALEKALILNVDFETTLETAKSGDFVYLDPPYIPLAETPSFTSYHSNGFGLQDQERLAKIMIRLKNEGVRAMCSNSDTSLTREVYSSLNIGSIQAPRMVSAKPSGRGHVSELVITNYK